MKESAQDTITLHHQNKQMRSEIGRFKSENYHLRLSSTRSLPSHNGVTELTEESLGDTSKLRIEAPPLIPALITGRYCIKWTQLADLPAPMYRAFSTVQNTKVYIAGGTSPVDYAMHRVFVYDAHSDRWDQLPPSGYHHGVPHIIGSKLALIGGCLSTAMKRTNKVSTFDETSQSWTSYYPDLLSARSTPGVVTHLEHVIVAGGRAGDDTAVAQDDIEILNWIENSQWKKVSISLPVPMWSFTPIIADDHLVIVGYSAGSAMKRYTGSYKIPITDITDEQQKNNSKSNKKKTKWTTMASATHWSTALVSNSLPLMVVGGQNYNGHPTSDIKMYDEYSKSWRTMASLSSARTDVAVAAVGDNAIIAIGGFTKAGSVSNALASSLTTVELGQAQLSH